MIEKLNQSSENVIGFKLIGNITKADYDVMVPEVEALVQQGENARILLDMTEFNWEKVNAWGEDMKFGREFRKNLEKMAIVGDKKWEKWLTKMVSPFYAREAQYYHSDDIESAWVWLRD